MSNKLYKKVNNSKYSNFNDEEIGSPRAGSATFASTLARGLSLIAAFRPGEICLGNAELARRCQLTRPTVARLAATLVEMGYLRHGPGAKYRLGLRLLAMIHPLLSGMAFRQAVRPIMKDLSDYARGAVNIAALDGPYAVFVETCVGPEPHPLTPDVGTTSLLVHTAAGRALLAQLSDEELTATYLQIEQIDSELMARYRTTVEREVQRVRESGYALSLGDDRSDVHVVGVPLGRSASGELLSLNCSVPIYRLAADSLVRDLAPRTLSAARAIGELVRTQSAPANIADSKDKRDSTSQL